jgi:predicted ATP-dependent serine protease
MRANLKNLQQQVSPEPPLIEFLSPSQIKSYDPPEELFMVGDCHIMRGNAFVIGGAPGVGKSRGLMALAIAGATGQNWFGLKVHRRFRTLIIQTENGRYRMSKELAQLECSALDDYLRISSPPPYGLLFGRENFRTQVAAAIAKFIPDLVALDPWNAAAREQDSREYLDTFAVLKSVLPPGDDAPCTRNCCAHAQAQNR